eukprot:TRINITY_DN4633_c0_g1_i1.p1 TRINITY_DN4633_c0_g1~~TRINITY_DN4633_c0_g1_i1.p1  ORF type:complete len:390 (-),score=83.53 TRINITY_DN4633_c0_g1_i1:230-1399(-)
MAFGAVLHVVEDVLSPFGVLRTLGLGIVLGILVTFVLLQLFGQGGKKKAAAGFDASAKATKGFVANGVSLSGNAKCDHLHLQAYSDQFNDPPNEYHGFLAPACNVETPWPFNNEAASGTFLPLHRPTYNKEVDASVQYPYAWHFSGRKRLWEMRIQLRFKREIENSKVRFGIELDDYVPTDRASASMMKLTVGALRRVVGDQLYHSVGDQPGQGKNGERERPVFVMPLWAFDQFIVTPEGEEPPNLTHDISEMGELRTSGKREFIKKSLELRLVPGPTYTFCFWGISRFLDDLNWQVKNVVPMATVDFNKFCGSPPVHLVFYELNEAAGENRHVDSRKKYIFHLAFWSSKSPPKPERLRQMLPNTHSAIVAAEARGRRSRSFLACCLGR